MKTSFLAMGFRNVESNPPTLKWNGRSIMEVSKDMELKTYNASTGFVFDGTDWRNDV